MIQLIQQTFYIIQLCLVELQKKNPVSTSVIENSFWTAKICFDVLFHTFLSNFLECHLKCEKYTKQRRYKIYLRWFCIAIDCSLNCEKLGDKNICPFNFSLVSRLCSVVRLTCFGLGKSAGIPVFAVQSQGTSGSGTPSDGEREIG